MSAEYYKTGYTMKKGDVATGVRLPKNVHKRVWEIAQKDYRTFNSALIMVLLAGLEKPRIEQMFDIIIQKLGTLEQTKSGGDQL